MKLDVMCSENAWYLSSTTRKLGSAQKGPYNKPNARRCQKIVVREFFSVKV